MGATTNADSAAVTPASDITTSGTITIIAAADVSLSVNLNDTGDYSLYTDEECLTAATISTVTAAGQVVYAKETSTNSIVKFTIKTTDGTTVSVVAVSLEAAGTSGKTTASVTPDASITTNGQITISLS